MSFAALIEEYLAKAKEAEDQASRCQDQNLKDSWLAMAMSYRKMAQHELDGLTAKVKSADPSQSPASDTREAD